MSFPHWFQPLRRASLIAIAVLLAASFAITQPALAQDQSRATGYSSSQAGLSASGLQLSEFSLSDSPATGASASGGGSGQYGNGGGYGDSGTHGLFHNLTFEAGGGFNAPVGNDTPFITWGGNFTAGAGLRFSKRVSALLEYQFMDDKLPAGFLAEFPPEDQITAGNSHINSITGSPVIDLFPKKSNGVYLVGGFGWYRKSTNLQTPELTFDYYGDEYYENVTVASFTSSQWGGNAGLGIYHRLGGGMYGSDSGHTEIFAEARYTFIHTPAVTQTNGLGTTELIPVTLGVRF
jgi:hypothetical protein